MTIVTNLTVDLLAMSQQLKPEITARELGVLLGQLNAGAMPAARTTPRRIIEMIEGTVPRAAKLEVLRGFADGPWLRLVEGAAWNVCGSGRSWSMDETLEMFRVEAGQDGAPDRYVVLTKDSRPPACWGRTTVTEWMPDPAWTYMGDFTQAAYVATTSDNKFKAPSVHAFLVKVAGRL